MLTCVESYLESFDPKKSLASSTGKQIINLPGISVLAMYFAQVVAQMGRHGTRAQSTTLHQTSIVIVAAPTSSSEVYHLQAAVVDALSSVVAGHEVHKGR